MVGMQKSGRILFQGNEMSHGINKYQSRESRRRVRQVLMEHWDPIGVRDSPEASDEYDTYVGEVYVMLMDHRASEDAINAYLFSTATGDMGLSPSDFLAAASANTASILVTLRSEFELH
jgi:hypothetical protein